MKVSLKCFATLADGQHCDFKDSERHEVQPGETVGNLVERLKIDREQVRIVFVNGRSESLEKVLDDGDQIALAPATGGM